MPTCISCPNDAIPPARGCTQCLEKVRLEHIEACEASMRADDADLPNCLTAAEYRSNRACYRRSYMEVYYLKNGDRPDKVVKKKQSMREQWANLSHK